MNISKKIFLSNIIISVITLSLLSIATTLIIRTYIVGDIEKQLMIENKLLVDVIEYKKMTKIEDGELVVSLDYFESDKRVKVAHMVILDDEISTILEIVPHNWLNLFDEKAVSELNSKEDEEIFTYNFAGKSFMVYKKSLEIIMDGQAFDISIVTMVSNRQVTVITNQIIGAVLMIVLIVSIVSLLMTLYLGRKLTNPIYKLVDLSNKIANKALDERVEIKTGDELEVLGNAMNQMAKELVRKDLEQKQFYEHVSHDIKTPLTVISGYAEGINNGIFDDDREALDTIVEECGLLKKQIEDVIYLSQLETTKKLYEPIEVDLNDLMIEVLNKLESLTVVQDIDVIFDPKEPIRLYMDYDKMRRVLMNILSNCIKYTKDQISVELISEHQSAFIYIKDNGPGFDKDLLNNPFSGLYKGNKEGNGIGLMIIKKIVDGHKGEVLLSNGEDGGAVYQIELPL